MYSSLNPSRGLKGGWPHGCGWLVSSNPIRVIPVGDRFQHPYVSNSAHGTSGWLLFSHSVVSDSLWPHGLHTTPGFLVLHYLLEFAQTHAHRVCHPTISSSSAAREKQQVTYKGNLICLTPDFSAETLQARRDWQDIFKVLKGKNLQPRLQYQARISFKIDGEIKSFQRSKS